MSTLEDILTRGLLGGGLAISTRGLITEAAEAAAAAAGVSVTRDELLGSTVLFLLEVHWAGVHRFAEWVVDVPSTEHGAVHFHGGLAVSYAEAFDLFNLSTSPVAVPVRDIVFPVDVAELVQQGHRLSGARATLSMLLEGATYENRVKLVEGVVDAPNYGRAGEPMSFSVVARLSEDRALIPAAAAKVSPETWSDADDAVQGRYYPTVFGQPGPFETYSTAGSPGLLVDLGTNVLLIAGHATDAGERGATVRIIDFEETDPDYHSGMSVARHTVDGRGRVVTVVDLKGPTWTTNPAVRAAEGHEYWVGWINGGGLLADRGGAIEGGGELLEWFCNQSTLQVDRGRFAAVSAYLDRFKFGGFIDDPVAPIDYLTDEVLPLMPVSLAMGPSGVVPIVWRWDAPPSASTAHLVEGAELIFEGRVQYEGRAKLLNEGRLSYVPRQDTIEDGGSQYRRTVALTGRLVDGSAEEMPDLYANASRNVFGERAESFETTIVWERSTAVLCLHWQIRARSFPRRVVRYANPSLRWGGLRRGQLVKLTHEDLHLDEQLALVRSVSWSGGIPGIELVLIEDLVRD